MEHVQIYFKNFNKIIKITGITNFPEFFSFSFEKNVLLDPDLHSK